MAWPEPLGMMALYAPTPEPVCECDGDGYVDAAATQGRQERPPRLA